MATFCWMLVVALMYLPSQSIYCNSTKGIPAFQPPAYGLHCLCAACFNFCQPKVTISMGTHSTATACDYCSSHSIKPSRHLTAPSFLMHASAWCLQRRSRALEFHSRLSLRQWQRIRGGKKHFRNDLINHQTLPPTHTHTHTRIHTHTHPPQRPSLLFILSCVPLKQRCRRGSVQHPIFFPSDAATQVALSFLSLPPTSTNSPPDPAGSQSPDEATVRLFPAQPFLCHHRGATVCECRER